MTSGVFISFRGYLDEGGGGVQVCTHEYRDVIEAAGIDLSIMAVDFDRRLSTRLLRRIDSSPYLRPMAPPSLEHVLAGVASSKPQFIFLNQVSLATIAQRLRTLVPASTRIVLLSHGMESTDLLHLIRLRRTLPLSGRVRPWPDLALGRVIRSEAASRRHVDAVITLSPFDVELEHWIGSSRIDWLPRIITNEPLDWRPVGDRLGYVGTLDHAPNLEGLVATFEAMARQPGEHPRIRIVGDPPHIGAWLTARYASADYLGRLDAEALSREAASWSGFIHPIFCSPRGCSTKLATAIGWRIPVVTTSQGRRGYDWREGSLIEAVGPDDFARRALALSDPAFARSARAEVARVAATSPTKTEVAARLRQILDVVATDGRRS